MELYTEQLALRPICEDDFETLQRIFTNEAVRKYLFDDTIVSAGQVKEFIATSLHHFKSRSYGLWLLVEKTTKARIGIAGLWHFLMKRNRNCYTRCYPKPPAGVMQPKQQPA